jgi:hypothetical protein
MPATPARAIETAELERLSRRLQPLAIEKILLDAR